MLLKYPTNKLLTYLFFSKFSNQKNFKFFGCTGNLGKFIQKYRFTGNTKKKSGYSRFPRNKIKPGKTKLELYLILS